MPKPILVANWKNNPDSLDNAKKIISGYQKKSLIYKKLSMFIAPASPYFDLVSSKTNKFASLAVQDVPLIVDGVHTGEISFDILKSFGVRLAIIGHSERRAQGETNEITNHKIKNCLKAGIVPLLCIGEKEKDNTGEHFEFIREQLVGALYKITKKEDISKIMIAYEPVWAIGKNSQGAMDPSDIAETVIYIKKVLSDMYGRTTSDKIALLYGGSVDAQSAGNIYKSGVNGFLVGRASLDPEQFTKIANSII